MGISLNKKVGINLKKGSSISLEKDGKVLEQICIGLNWGAISKKVFFGMFKDRVHVDLDGSVSMFGQDKEELDTVYYKKLRSFDKSIIHSGDDIFGDPYGDDGRDNEIITIDLKRVSPKVEQIVFFLNSFKKQDFADIPYSKIRIFEGDWKEVRDVLATFNLSADPAFAGYISMVLGKLIRKPNGAWEFKTIGEPVSTQKIDDTIDVIQEKFLD